MHACLLPRVGCQEVTAAAPRLHRDRSCRQDGTQLGEHQPLPGVGHHLLQRLLVKHTGVDGRRSPGVLEISQDLLHTSAPPQPWTPVLPFPGQGPHLAAQRAVEQRGLPVAQPLKLNCQVVPAELMGVTHRVAHRAHRSRPGELGETRGRYAEQGGALRRPHQPQPVPQPLGMILLRRQTPYLPGCDPVPTRQPMGDDTQLPDIQAELELPWRQAQLLPRPTERQRL